MSKISRRLMVYFTLALLLLSLALGSIFGVMFSSYTKKLHRQELITRAENISLSLGGLLENHEKGQRSMQQMQGGLGAYLSFIDDIAMSDVWLIGMDDQMVTRAKEKKQLEFKEFPRDVEQLIEEVLTGKTLVSENFSSVLHEANLSVGVPILGSDGQILGGVFLHGPIEGLKEGRRSQFILIAISLGLALLFSFPFAWVLSLRFTKPLNRMKKTALGLASGDYSLKNNIVQSDEIGELAGVMDVLSLRLMEAKLEQESREEKRDVFLANISHELRTPVTVIRSSLEALCDGIVTQPEKTKEYHNQMLKESIQLQRLVNDLLELSKLQSTDFSMKKEPIAMGELLLDIARSMESLAVKKDIHILLEKTQPFVMEGDYGRLRQMIIVALDNAIRFSPKGEDVFLKEEISEDSYCLCVIDGGPGISKEEFPYLFDRFHNRKEREEGSGSGLGLTIAQEIARRHAMKIEVESIPGKTQVCFVYKLQENHS